MYDYRNNLKGQDDRRSVYDILSLNGTETDSNGNIILHEYEAVGIEKVVIDGNTFSNYGAYQFIWEKTFVKSPERSASGSLGNLNSYATFLTPHLILDFSIMSIDDYRAIMKLHYEKNEFTVECYDPIYNNTIKAKMYFGTEEMAKLYTINRKRLNSQEEWEDWIELVGVREYKVELIGTNNEIELVSVTYHLNPPDDVSREDYTIGEPDVYNGEEIVIGASASSITRQTFGGSYVFDKWNTSANPKDTEKGVVYIDGNVSTIGKYGLTLYAQWRSTTEHILSYNYGLADPEINESDYSYVTNKKVAYGQRIGALPNVEVPKVKAKDIIDGKEKEYSPYYNGAWYTTPVKGNDSVALYDNIAYWAFRDSTIYLLYDTKKYPLNLYLDGKLYQSNSFAYNTDTNLPLLVKSGSKFDGWYYTSDFKQGTKFSGNMPPYDLTLYARWVNE